MEKIWEDDNEPLDYLDLGVPYFQVQTHSCCQIRELVGCWSPWTRWKKAGIGQLFDAHAKCHWNWNKYIYIYWYKKRHQPNQIPSGNQTWFAEKSTICSWFSHSNFHFDRGCPIIATFWCKWCFTRTGAAEIAADFISSPDFTLTIFTPAATLEICQGPGWKSLYSTSRSVVSLGNPPANTSKRFWSILCIHRWFWVALTCHQWKAGFRKTPRNPNFRAVRRWSCTWSDQNRQLDNYWQAHEKYTQIYSDHLRS